AAAALMLKFGRMRGKQTTAVVLVSARADYRSPIEIVGTDGAVRADNGLNVEHPITIEVLRGGKIIHSEQVTNYDAHTRQVDAFALSLRGQQAFLATREDGLRTQLVLDAAYRSIESGHSQHVATAAASNVTSV